MAPTDDQLDELARQWADGDAVVLRYDGEGRPVYGWQFSLPRFRNAVRAALASQEHTPSEDDLLAQRIDIFGFHVGATVR